MVDASWIAFPNENEDSIQVMFLQAPNRTVAFRQELGRPHFELILHLKPSLIGLKGLRRNNLN